MPPTPPSQSLLHQAVALALEKRAEDVVALDVSGLVDYMDYLLLLTGRSARQNRAIADNLIRGLKRHGHVPLSRSGMDAGAWICLDYVDVVVHVFDPETREHYDLELLWADAEHAPLDLPAVSVTVKDDERYDEGVVEPPSS